jgi:hypothetical protein
MTLEKQSRQNDEKIKLLRRSRRAMFSKTHIYSNYYLNYLLNYLLHI